MSIASEIARLQDAKADILAAIAAKGVTVPAGSALSDCAALIASIPSSGSSLPTGYKQCQYVKSIGQGSIYNHSGGTPIITDVAWDDTITFYYELGDITTTYNSASIFGYYFKDANSIRGINIGTGTNIDYVNITGFNRSSSLPLTTKDVLITRVGSSGSLTINEDVNTDSYGYRNVTHLDHIFSTGSNPAILGGKLFYLRIYGNNTSLKHNFLPLKKNGTTDVLYDVVTGIEFVLNSNQFVNGPVME